MKNNFSIKPASQDEMTLYCFMGEAVCMIQELESALSCAITIRNNSTATRAEADEALNKQRHYTLGMAVRLAQKQKFFPLTLQSDLNNFFQERNWLIHQAMFENMGTLSTEADKNRLFDKIKSIAIEAQTLKRAIEMDMINFAESKGKDMSKVRAAIEGYENRQ